VEAHSPTGIFLFERFCLDRRGLFRRDEVAALAPVEIGSRALDVLGVLLERPGDLLSRDEIMVAAWPGIVVEDNNLTVQISTLRRILDQDRVQGSCIQTVPGRGYRFIAPVTRFEPAASSASAALSGNGSNGPIAENEQAQGPGAPGQIGRTAEAPASGARSRLWVPHHSYGHRRFGSRRRGGRRELAFTLVLGCAPRAAPVDCRDAIC
jgi:DNA-binding winged helix-turn-helix (wHTH) protein